MDFLPEDLIRSFDSYEAMQAEHLEALAGDAPDIETMNFERKRNFAGLHTGLQSLLGQMQGPQFPEETREEIRNACNRRITAILETDSRIEEGIRHHRERASRTLANLRKGKTAIRGYAGSTNSQSLFRLSR